MDLLKKSNVEINVKYFAMLANLPGHNTFFEERLCYFEKNLTYF